MACDAPDKKKYYNEHEFIYKLAAIILFYLKPCGLQTMTRIMAWSLYMASNTSIGVGLAMRERKRM